MFLQDAASRRASDPTRAAETAVLGQLQRRLRHPCLVSAARGMSHFGEHAGGWLALGVLGAAVDRPRRREWLRASGAVALAHGVSIGVKRVVRRPRPDDDSIKVRVGTPSRLSFPSSHACSTTAAAVAFGGLLGWRLSPVLVPPMLLSRLVLGVHFPTDVLAGSVLGAAVAKLAKQGAR
ncbi:MAG: phosphatase PAP2 family protein [Actinomycetota bacterium]|nr:phosphatase PAP2 family protein [Actinomycetota bacterium]